MPSTGESRSVFMEVEMWDWLEKEAKKDLRNVSNVLQVLVHEKMKEEIQCQDNGQSSGVKNT